MCLFWNFQTFEPVADMSLTCLRHFQLSIEAPIFTNYHLIWNMHVITILCHLGFFKWYFLSYYQSNENDANLILFFAKQAICAFNNFWYVDISNHLPNASTVYNSHPPIVVFIFSMHQKIQSGSLIIYALTSGIDSGKELPYSNFVS